MIERKYISVCIEDDLIVVYDDGTRKSYRHNDIDRYFLVKDSDDEGVVISVCIRGDKAFLGLALYDDEKPLSSKWSFQISPRDIFIAAPQSATVERFIIAGV